MREFAPLHGVRTIALRHVARASVAFWVVAAIALLAACGTANEAALDAPSAAPLSIPELLEPTLDGEGVAHYDLTIGKSRHDYRQAALTDTYSYNGLSVLGPTLRLRTGDSVVISVTNELDETTTTHWHGDDIPVIIQDRDFTEDGQLDFAIDDGEDGNLDSVLTVNGTINPYVEAPEGLVRLRLLNGSQARIYHLAVEGADMTKIASDGGYLAGPVAIEQLVLAPGDRAEIVVNVGTESASLVDSALGRVLELRPDGSATGAGMLPDELAAIERISESEVTVDRSFHMDDVRNFWEFAPTWAINGVQMDMGRIDVTVQLGDTERWTLSASSMSSSVA